MSDCLVSQKDYRRYWPNNPDPPAATVPATWDGTEHRVGVSDRRAGHDRRWEASTGRRFRLTDRRRGRVSNSTGKNEA